MRDVSSRREAERLSLVRRIKDKLFLVILVVLSMAAFLPLFHIVASILYYGGWTLLRGGLSFLVDTPPSPLSSNLGGIGPALVGSAVLVFLTVILGLPLSFMAAVFTVEYPNTLVARVTKLVCRSFTEIPTVLIGVLSYTLVVIPMGRFSALAGAVALAIVMVPYSYTYMEESLASIPRTYREAAYSLGLTRPRAVFSVFTRIARRGILTGVLIGLAKAAGETAPLLFTIGGLRHAYFNGPDHPVGAIPLLIYEFALTPYRVYREVAWGAALVLIAIYLVIFVVLRRTVREVRM